MAKSFDENLGMFLTELRESAVNELHDGNSKYRELCLDLAEKMRRAKEIPTEYADIIEGLVDSQFALTRMEENRLYFQGFRDCINLYKRLDGGFRESQEFEELFA